MAIILHSEKYQEIRLDSHIINAVTGNDYQNFLKRIVGENIYYIDNTFIDTNKLVFDTIDNTISEKEINEYLSDLGLNRDFLNKNINKLSHSEQKLLKYFKMLVKNTNIIIIDEPFLDLDYDAKKKITSLFKKLVKKKTIIIGSVDTNVIYTVCKKVLLLGKNKFLYEDVSILSNKRILRQYHLIMPNIVAFIRMANDKKIKLPYSNDIRDLIKDVYKHVSK